MNVLIHGQLGWLLGQPLANRRDRVLLTLAGVAPDLDGLSLLAGQDAYGAWHHVLTHGALSAVLLCLLLAGFARERLRVLALGLMAFHLHLLCDLAGSGVDWPIFYLWPFSKVSIGWSGGWELASWQNSVIGLAVTLVALACAFPFGRTPFELASVRLDAQVVATLRRRFGRRSAGQGSEHP